MCRREDAPLADDGAAAEAGRAVRLVDHHKRHPRPLVLVGVLSAEDFVVVGRQSAASGAGAGQIHLPAGARQPPAAAPPRRVPQTAGARLRPLLHADHRAEEAAAGAEQVGREAEVDALAGRRGVGDRQRGVVPGKLLDPDASGQERPVVGEEQAAQVRPVAGVAVQRDVITDEPDRYVLGGREKLGAALVQVRVVGRIVGRGELDDVTPPDLGETEPSALQSRRQMTLKSNQRLCVSG